VRTAGAIAYKAKVDADRSKKERHRKRQAEQLRAKALIGCDSCRCSREHIRTEQPRMKAETMARHPEWFR
jgi:hypothetical protein